MPRLSIILSSVALTAAAGAAPNILFVLQDDYGWNDVGFHNDEAKPFTSAMTALAQDEGMILDRHYVFWYCSPTRRSFLSGRNPVHHGTSLSGASDDMDLRWTLISTKLASVGYTSYWYGKGHTGYKSTRHLPISQNFSDHYGYLTGSEDYQNAARWHNRMPTSSSVEYSTDAYGASALNIVQTHDASTPFFLYLPWQAVHTPYDLPVNTSLGVCGQSNSTIMQMICDSDAWMGKIIQALKDRKLWENTLMVYSSDNGGIEDGNNYPLRGEKTTDFDGGFRVNAFIAGGVLPSALHGTVNKALVHVTDWYPTLCHLAGVDPTDDSPVPPKAYDPKHPEIDIWGNDSYPGLDGVNVWDALMTPNAVFNAARDELVLTPTAMIKGKYKLITGQSHGASHRPHVALGVVFPPGGGGSNTGWRMPNGTWTTDNASWGCARSSINTTMPPTPCLFDIVSDPAEHHDLAAQQPEILLSMVNMLERAWAKNFTARSPASLLGPCNQTCAAAYYNQSASGRGVLFPICGVPGCAEAESLLV